MLDNGHGGRQAGQYMTPPSKGRKSPKWDQGVYYEGVGNRWMVNRIVEILERNDVPYYIVVPELIDVSLSERVQRADSYWLEAGREAYLASFHSNGGGGTGFEIWTSPGQTLSDPLATRFYGDVEKGFQGEIRMRPGLGDGDPDKEAKFTLLTDTRCPAFLFEWLFMDRKEDYDKLWDPEWLDRYCRIIAGTMIDIYRNGI